MSKNHAPWITIIARLGYSAKAVIFILMGWLIMIAAYNSRSADDVSKTSIFKEILYSPFGYVSLIAVTIGLFCYVIWRAVQGVLNTDNLDMKKPKEAMMRAFYFFSAIAYAMATFGACKVLAGKSKSSEGSDEETQKVSAFIMDETWGVVLVGVVGVIVLIFAFIQFKHAIKQDFMDKFIDEMSAAKEKMVLKVGRMGFAARGVVYGLVGGFILHAAITQDPDKTGGLPKALDTLVEQPFGFWLLGAVGAGMFCFGIFCGFEGRYRKV